MTDAFIGIEAAYYLDRFLKVQAKEPLLSALGGFPFSIKTAIEDDLESLQAARITPIFFFGGIEVGNKDTLLKDLSHAAILNAQAWDLYDQHEAQQAVDTFGNSGGILSPCVQSCSLSNMCGRLGQAGQLVQVLPEDLAGA